MRSGDPQKITRFADICRSQCWRPPKHIAIHRWGWAAAHHSSPRVPGRWRSPCGAESSILTEENY
jgi:hypothetical protein